MTAALFAQGTLLKLGDGIGGYTTIAEVKSISGPSLTHAIVDVTSHDSPSRWREKIGGLRDAGTVTFAVNWIPSSATHGLATGLLKYIGGGAAPVIQSYRIVQLDGTTWTFNAFVTKFTAMEPIDNVLAADLELVLTGAPTLA